MPIIGATELQPVNILGSYMSGLEMGRANQLAQQEQAAKIRDMQRKQQLNALLSSGVDINDPQAQMRVLALGGGTELKTLADLEANKLTRAKTQAEIDKMKREEQKTALDQALNFLATADDEAAYPAAYAQAVQLLGPEKIAAMGFKPQYDPVAIQKAGRLLLTEKDRLDQDERIFQRGVKERELGVSEANVGLRRGELGLQREKFAREGDVDFQRRLKSMEAQGKFEGEALAQARADLPDAVARAEQAIGVIDQMVGTRPTKNAKGEEIAGGKPHPGFTAAVGAGLGERFIPGTKAADFEALYDQVTGEAFLQAYRTLRGTGQITEIEGAKATAAITRMRLAQSEPEFIKAAREFQSVVESGVKKARSKAGQTAAPSGASAGRGTTSSGTPYVILPD